jgi:anti-sigma-K factor RskA
LDDHIIDLLPFYALRILEEEEIARVESHLALCDSCRNEFQEYQGVVDQLPLAVASLEPPEYIKTQLLQRARQTSAKLASAKLASSHANQAGGQSFLSRLMHYFRQTAPAWGIASLVLVVFLAFSNYMLWQRLNEIDKAASEALRTVPLSGTENWPQSSGLIVISEDGTHGAIVVDGLKDLGESLQYQLWLSRDGIRADGGVFSVKESGYTSKLIWAPDPLDSYTSFGVTIEPFGGSPSPTGEKVLGGQIE